MANHRIQSINLKLYNYTTITEKKQKKNWKKTFVSAWFSFCFNYTNYMNRQFERSFSISLLVCLCFCIYKHILLCTRFFLCPSICFIVYVFCICVCANFRNQTYISNNIVFKKIIMKIIVITVNNNKLDEIKIDQVVDCRH